MKQKVLKPGQLLTYNGHVYRLKKVRLELACLHCDLKECKNFYLRDIFPPCRWYHDGKYRIPCGCILTLVK